MRRIWLIGLLFCVVGMSAQSVKQDSVRVYFRQGQSVVDLHYRDNALNFARLSELYRLYANRSEYWLKGIRIVSSASPEGSFRLNQRLSEKRADAVLQFLKLHSELDSTLLKVNPLGEDWQGLRHWIESMPGVPERDAVLRSLDAYPHGQEGEWDLKRIAGGEAYRYLYKHIYPLLRQTHVVFDVRTLPPCPDPVYTLEHPTIYSAPLVRLPMEVVREDSTFTFAVKSNLLYDAVTALNVEVEVPIRNHWSVMVEHVFPWWETGNKYCLQLLETGVEGRYWFSDNRWHSQKLQGHFAGAYAMSGKYDFQWDRDLCYQGRFWSAGVTYGYTKKISRLFRLELSASLGYLSTKYQHYQPSVDYEQLYGDLEGKRKISYIGPTKLKVSLVMPIHLKGRRKM